MHDAATVRCCECVSHLNSDRERAAQIEWFSVNEVAHVTTLDVLHRDKLNVSDFMQTEDRADIWMIERGGELRFAFEANKIGSAVSESGRKDFDNRGTIERRIDDLVNSAL